MRGSCASTPRKLPNERGKSSYHVLYAAFRRSTSMTYSHSVRTECEYVIEVDRRKAAYSTWYELFPRSFGNFRGVEAQLPRIAKMGFDVLYLPPIHPIGTTFRKGKNNRVAADEHDAGSPWAIGAVEGGHTAIHPE